MIRITVTELRQEKVNDSPREIQRSINVANYTYSLDVRAEGIRFENDFTGKSFLVKENFMGINNLIIDAQNRKLSCWENTIKSALLRVAQEVEIPWVD